MPQIYLDCDGVLADFDKGAEAVLGLPPRQFERRYGLGQFWKRLALTDGFFEYLDLMPDAMELYEAVRHLDPIILTGLPRGNWAEPQKRRWAERHFPGVKVITTSAALKREHCHPGDALVDDTANSAISGSRKAASSSTTRTLPVRSGSWSPAASSRPSPTAPARSPPPRRRWCCRR